MFGVVWVELPEKWHLMPKTLAQIGGRNDTIFYILIAILLCVFAKNSVELTKNFRPKISILIFTITLFGLALFKLVLQTLSNTYSPFIYFNF